MRDINSILNNCDLLFKLAGNPIAELELIEDEITKTIRSMKAYYYATGIHSESLKRKLNELRRLEYNLLGVVTDN